MLWHLELETADAIWIPRPTPTYIPNITPIPIAPTLTPIPTVPRITPVPTVSGTILPMPGTVWITLEVQSDGQPKGAPVVYQIRTSDATKPLCQFIFDSACISKIERK